ncbi:MAG: hypothetical protein ACO3NK_07910 [Prochlorotrichaceae cyanobacterium]
MPHSFALSWSPLIRGRSFKTLVLSGQRCSDRSVSTLNLKLHPLTSTPVACPAGEASVGYRIDTQFSPYHARLLWD